MNYTADIIQDIISDPANDCRVDISNLPNYRLDDLQSREAFLYEVYWQGEGALFAAATHVWDSLAQPRKARGTAMGQASGAGGTGKTAVILTLRKFVGECLASVEPIPERDRYPTLEAWHLASMRSFQQDEHRVRSLCAVYAGILNGDPVALEASATNRC